MAVENVQQSATRNRILGALPEADFKLIAPSLARVSLEDGETLFHAEDVISHVYFVEGGLISLLSALEDGASIEVGMTGREGVAGVSVLLGADTSVHTALVQTGGEALRMRAGDAREAFRRSEALRNRVLNYTRLLLAYASQTAACNTIHTVEERLARWLLVARQRLESDRLPLTQEFLSHMLGVRRSGVTVAIGILQRAGLIEHRRGHVEVVDAEGLRAAACECAAVMTHELNQFLVS
jgi:CRP-like cAMP-binding protein